ncbi:hypothetical protein GCM10007886_08940 [Methylobacterium gregans]|uniref:Uncharacterized protein n=1 Tax=Methylobacterium gregans TaxID=374424 RepID=A0AA37HTN9_9HYPH|nr:hypothetical protein NBEOAGPD_4909 [Methylobacterium gregans]GLS52711.1 hypothetical protein GCM10007886_08940 [Methylobacterium gregans]
MPRYNDAWTVKFDECYKFLLKERSNGCILLEIFETFISVRCRMVSNNVKPPKKLECVFIEDRQIFAAIRSDNSCDYQLVISLGLMTSLVMAASAMVDRETCCFDLGRDGNPLDAYPAQDFQLAWSELIKNYRESPFRFVMPDEGWRIVLLHAIVDRTLDIIIYHEVIHYTKGHVDFVSGSSEAAKYAPILESRADDAAIYGSNFRLGMEVRRSNFNQGPCLAGFNGFPFKSASDLSELVAYSNCLTFILISMNDCLDVGVSVEDLEHGEDISIGYRLWRAEQLALSRKWNGIPWSEIIRRIAKSLAAVECSFGNYLNNIRSNDKYYRQYDQKLNQLDKEISFQEKEWAKKYARIRPMPSLSADEEKILNMDATTLEVRTLQGKGFLGMAFLIVIPLLNFFLRRKLR